MKREEAIVFANHAQNMTELQDVKDFCAMAEAAIREQEERRWIPVSERKPDLIPCNAGTAYSEAVMILTSGRKVMVAIWDGIDWIAPFNFWKAWDEKVTNWMPIPVPPKEGTT